MLEALSSAWTWARLLEEMGSNTYAVARSRRAACFVLSLPLDADDQRIEAAMLEVVQLRAGGCARDQSTTQFCAEVVERDARIARMRENALGTGAVLKELSDENEYLRAEIQRRIDHGNALYLTIVQRLTPYFPAGDRGLDWDVLPGTLEGLAQERDKLSAEVSQWIRAAGENEAMYVAQCAELRVMSAALEEQRLTLAAECGEQAGAPSERWRWSKRLTAWVLPFLPEHLPEAYRRPWQDTDEDHDPEVKVYRAASGQWIARWFRGRPYAFYPTARAAMLDVQTILTLADSHE